MDKKLLKILDSIKAYPSDEHQFGLRMVRLIKHSEALHNPENNFKYLRNYLADNIVSLKAESTFYEKYTPAIYHPNAAYSRELDIETSQKIIDGIKEL